MKIEPIDKAGDHRTGSLPETLSPTSVTRHGGIAPTVWHAMARRGATNKRPSL